jgi:hypothetical protein
MKEELSKLSGVDKSNIKFGDVQLGRFFQLFNDNDSVVTQIHNSLSNVFAYVLNHSKETLVVRNDANISLLFYKPVMNFPTNRGLLRIERILSF